MVGFHGIEPAVAPARLGVIAALAATFLCSCLEHSKQDHAPQALAPSRPNILLIVADDLGYSDLSVQGAKDLATPNIDRLASQGVLLTDNYANHPVCAPSRAAILTGKYQQRFGFENNPGLSEAANFGVPLTEVMLPERLRKQGYITGMFGKWHVGGTPEKAPTARGFDTFYGFLGGAMAYTPDGPTGSKVMLRGTQRVEMPAHTTEAFANEAIAFIEENRNQPFFAYVAFNAVHAPMQSTSEYLARFAKEPDPTRRAHLAMLAALDEAVGRIVDAIDSNGLGDRTLVVFTSDNGGPTWQTTSSNGPLNGVKALTLEGGVRVPAIFRWVGHLPAGKVSSAMAMGFDITATAEAIAGVGIQPDQDGVNLIPYLNGDKPGNPHDKLFWRSDTQGGMRDGPWKMVKVGADYYLFDLRTDIGERRDLAKGQSKRLEAMKSQWAKWSSAMAEPAWGRTGQTGTIEGQTTAERNEQLRDLVRRYIAGLPVDPKSLLYGGGPE